jgi:hypothetical protein
MRRGFIKQDTVSGRKIFVTRPGHCQERQARQSLESEGVFMMFIWVTARRKTGARETFDIRAEGSPQLFAAVTLKGGLVKTAIRKLGKGHPALRKWRTISG